uniref:FxSxx-COOH system tetratricopeptide repeat protein n=1 Tax=Paractinoplanes polyasparticus TaxID=2856853 RepID=UPI001C866C19|nr:FxSxx-COOH system tetratricopeptide repeat protein [Actinoplanes polyasparticus]
MESSGAGGQVITFYSFKGGVGRTMALANVAWILASTGRRVLTVDWDLESPGLHRYFAPFLADRDLRHSAGVIEAITRFEKLAARAVKDGGSLSPGDVQRLARVRDFATSLERYDFPRGGSIDFVCSGRQVTEYSQLVSHFDWDTFYAGLNGQEFLAALAEDMRGSYDIVLIDSRTGLSDNAGICTVALPDVVVDCFAYNNQSIDGAGAVADSIRRMRPDIRIFPVPSRVEDGETAKLDRRRGLAQQRFRDYIAALGFTDHGRYWGRVELPYKILYAYEETLAVFGDRPYQENTLLAAYERLAGELVGEEINLPTIPETIRRGWLSEFEQRGSATPQPALICYTPRDRIWAEWVGHELQRAGQRYVLRDVKVTEDADELVAHSEYAIMLLSRESVRLPQMLHWWELASRRDLPGYGRFLVPVRVDGTRPPTPFSEREPVDMFNVPERVARDALLARLDIRDFAMERPPASSGPHPRFPFEPARVWRAPARNTSFTGRDATLEELRERLNSSTAQTGPAVLQGIGGVGKTQIAVEYLHRFAADYDVVWWISADQPQLVVTALADLAGELGLTIAGSGRADDEAAAVLEALRLGKPSKRWILVFDNTEDPEHVRRFLPNGGGDVIVTTPGQEWSRTAWTLDINVFDRSESRTLLTNRVPGLTDADADQIAAKLGDLPLAVEQAAMWLATTAMSAHSYLEILDQQLPRILNEPPPPGYRHPAAETWRLSQKRLRVASPAAAFLVELLAFLAPEPIPAGLLDSPGMADALAVHDPALRDRLMRNSLVREATRFGLARVDSAVHALRMHRLVQSVIMGDLAPEEQSRRREQIHVILAKAQPGEPSDQRNWPVYQGLLAHLEPSGALDSDDIEVHALTIDMVRYLRYRGDFAGSARLADRALTNWEPRLGQDHLSVLRLRSELGNILLARGDYQDALEIEQQVVARMTALRGETYPYALIALSGAAAAYAGLGQYGQAVELGDKVLVHWQATVGDSNLRTVLARNNLAQWLYLAGDFSRARELGEQVAKDSEEFLGAVSRDTLLHKCNLGRFLRADGDLVRSEAVLRETLESCLTALDKGHRVTATAQRELATTLRRLGQLEEARKQVEKAAATLTIGVAEHPDAFACELELAAISAADGKPDVAVTGAREAWSRYQRVLGDRHPFTLAAANDLAIYLVAAGAAGPPEARALLSATVDGFREVLTDVHPYVSICRMNFSSVLFSAGETVAAQQLDTVVLSDLRERLRNRSHPVAVAAARNLATSRLATGDRSGADALMLELDRIGTDPGVNPAPGGTGRVWVDIETSSP